MHSSPAGAGHPSRNTIQQTVSCPALSKAPLSRKWHLDRFSRFCAVQHLATQTTLCATSALQWLHLHTARRLCGPLIMKACHRCPAFNGVLRRFDGTILRPVHCKNIRISTDILWRVFHILTDGIMNSLLKREPTWACTGFIFPPIYGHKRIRNRFR